jgi:hypothetical protein
MSVDNWTREHHLTPAGWTRGTYKFYGKVQGDELPRPSDAIETWEDHCTQASQWSREDHDYREIWHNPQASKQERDAMHKKFPSPWETKKR